MKTKTFPNFFYDIAVDVLRLPEVTMYYAIPEHAQSFRNQYINFIEHILDTPNKSPQQITMAQTLSRTSVKTHENFCIIKHNPKPLE